MRKSAWSGSRVWRRRAAGVRSHSGLRRNSTSSRAARSAWKPLCPSSHLPSAQCRLWRWPPQRVSRVLIHVPPAAAPQPAAAVAQAPAAQISHCRWLSCFHMHVIASFGHVTLANWYTHLINAHAYINKFIFIFSMKCHGSDLQRRCSTSLAHNHPRCSRSCNCMCVWSLICSMRALIHIYTGY